jgi:SHAQKYF class myb-like DNA-binding protein
MSEVNLNVICRYWSEEEHEKFLDAMQTLGPKDVKAIAAFVGTRSATQVRTHAQKYFLKLVSKIRKLVERESEGEEGGVEVPMNVGERGRMLG